MVGYGQIIKGGKRTRIKFGTRPQASWQRLDWAKNGRHRVCYGRRGLVWYQYAEQVDIEVVVDQPGTCGLRGGATSWTVKGALREAAVGSVKGGLEHVGKLVEDIGDLGGVGMVVHKGGQSCSCAD